MVEKKWLFKIQSGTKESHILNGVNNEGYTDRTVEITQ